MALAQNWSQTGQKAGAWPGGGFGEPGGAARQRLGSVPSAGPGLGQPASQ